MLAAFLALELCVLVAVGAALIAFCGLRLDMKAGKHKAVGMLALSTRVYEPGVFCPTSFYPAIIGV